jgi:hypothetical protein
MGADISWIKNGVEPINENKFKEPEKIEYESIDYSYVSKEQAIAIACSDRNLKDSVFKEGKEKWYYGLIVFNKLKIGLAKYKNSSLCWHIIVTKGTWGATIKNLFSTELADGEFTEESDISCIIDCRTGEYYYKNEYEISDLSPASMEEYEYQKKYYENYD